MFLVDFGHEQSAPGQLRNPEKVKPATSRFGHVVLATHKSANTQTTGRCKTDAPRRKPGRRGHGSRRHRRHGELPRSPSLPQQPQQQVAQVKRIADVTEPTFRCRPRQHPQVCPGLRGSRRAPPWTTRVARTSPKPIRPQRLIPLIVRQNAGHLGEPSEPDTIQNQAPPPVARPQQLPHVFLPSHRRNQIWRGHSLKGGRISERVSLGPRPLPAGLQRTGDRKERTSPAPAYTVDSAQLLAETRARLSVCPRRPSGTPSLGRCVLPRAKEQEQPLVGPLPRLLACSSRDGRGRSIQALSKSPRVLPKPSHSRDPPPPLARNTPQHAKWSHLDGKEAPGL